MTNAETLKLRISGMSCGGCVAAVRRALDRVPGIEVVSVEVGSASLRAADDAAAHGAIEVLSRAGFDAEPANAS